MAGNTCWKPDNDGKEHPEDSILLAYIRRQQLEEYLKISQHIDVEQCPRCLHKCSELAQVSITLDVLGQMAQYQRYPELSVDRTFAYVQKAADKRKPVQAYPQRTSNRQRPRMSAIRLFSLPAAFGLTILFTVVMLVLAHLSNVPWLPGSPQGTIRPSQNNSTGVAPQRTTPPPNLASTATAVASVSPTPTASLVSRPNIKICSTHADSVKSLLVICGNNFESGHKVALVVTLPGKAPATLPPVIVNKQGKFQDSLSVNNCKNLPTSIFAYEVDNPKVASQAIINFSFAGCPAQTPNAETHGD